MPRNYPHLNDTRFPDLDSENVYKYQNNFDYDRYKETVKIKMLNVSWCGDYENAVYFETKAKRDKWFEEQKGLVKELPTMFRLYNDGSLKVDIPIDECMDYNYVMIDYGKLPQQDSVSDNSKMFYFINNVSQASPNATTLMLSVDYWTTFINDMDISYVNLLRGHAPMAETNADTYLANPIENSEFLLTEDVNYGYFQRVTNNTNIIFNDTDDICLGFLTNGDMEGVWTDRVATEVLEFGQMLSAVDIFVTDMENWHQFYLTVNAQCPQFWQTVKGMFAIPRKLLIISKEFTFCGIRCWAPDTTGSKHIADYVISKEKFGYPANISSIAKLYTFPYAAIEVSDLKGNTTVIRVEDTVGKLEVHTIMCDMYPFLNVEGYMTGVGSGVKSTITFHNVYQNTFTIGGKSYDLTNKWSIPVFAVQLTPEEDWLLNGKIGADAGKTAAYNNADTASANAALRVTTNSANTTAGNTAMYEHAGVANNMAAENAGISNRVISQTASSEISAADEQASITSNTMTATAQNSANSAMASSVINGVGGIATSAMSGGAAGAGIAAVGAIANLASTGVQNEYALTNASIQAGAVVAGTNVANGLKQVQAVIHTTENVLRMGVATSGTNSNADIDAGYNTTLNNNNNALTTASTANSVNTAKANADLSWDAAHNQTLIHNHPMFGQMTGTPDIISKPFGYAYNVVTQSKNAIRQTAEQFLRYGYTLNMQWNIDTFNKMPKFTYWLCDVVYCNDNGVYEGAQEEIKRILNNGVTVWRNPDEIGLVSIYSNL